MEDKTIVAFLKNVLANMPKTWLNLTTHRLDIYDEKLAKTQFITKFESLFNQNNSKESDLMGLPTAYDYIRLGHPLSCVLEWFIASLSNLNAENAISFSSRTMPVLAILRKNLLDKKNTRILYKAELPACFDAKLLRVIYGYKFELKQLEKLEETPYFNGSTIYLATYNEINTGELPPNIDFYVTLYPKLGSVLLVKGDNNESYIPEIQHVRRRETIAMTPANCLLAINSLLDNQTVLNVNSDCEGNKTSVLNLIKSITNTVTKPLVASSGLSMQYAIMMGIIHDAQENHKDKNIKIIVPTNCYGGTNDQARRVAACMPNAEVVDLAVDGDHDMVKSIETILNAIAREDAIPYIIAEIPTNPRVEVPDLLKLKEVLEAVRKTKNGEVAIAPVFILDQTFCPNLLFLGTDEILANVRAISYVSGSKFPSGGKCTAGYCVGNTKTTALMEKIEQHLILCDNEATALQVEILAAQLPSMNKRIYDAYNNTREFVNFIQKALPEAKINFVSEHLAGKGFTPSVFSLDLPTRGNTDEERESYKRMLNHKLINLMITEIPSESKYCVSYGQLNGCYWTIPATSTQGTTKEGDKDYIARVAVSPNIDLERHKEVFLNFVENN
jgi:cystathionine beta-lyase/cystathionine gamma-synthase